jgi:signal transduction histidine kinase
LDRGKRELVAALADRMVLYLRERKLWEELELSNRRSLLGWVAPGLVHEIKNPLTALSALVQLAPVKLTDPQFQASFYPVMKREIERILERTHHWQDFIRPLDPKASVFRMDEAVEQVLRLARPLFLEHQVVLEQDLRAISLKGCPDQVESLVLNLLLNSLNASEKGGKVKIELRKAKGKGPWLELSVRDEGKGIEPSRLERIFEPYHSTGPQGTGLGLFLSRRIAENHGGTLKVKSSPGKGALFTLRLPASS